MPLEPATLPAFSWEMACRGSPGKKASSICCLGVVRVHRAMHRRTMTAFRESLPYLRPLIFAYSLAKTEVFARSLSYTLPLCSEDFSVV